MTLIEALKSGKPFTRPGMGYARLLSEGIMPYSFSANEVLATDWEIIELKVEITRGQLRKAWVMSHPIFSLGNDVFDNLSKELGL